MKGLPYNGKFRVQTASRLGMAGWKSERSYNRTHAVFVEVAGAGRGVGSGLGGVGEAIEGKT